jgi:predicted nucleotidyltransferase
MNESAKPAPQPIQGNALKKLRGGDPSRWPNVDRADSLSRDRLALITEIARDLLPRDEGSLVVFGSLARREFTPDSDIDWAVMIDGRADSSHLKIVHSLKSMLKEAGFKEPGPTEVFGGLVFSHDLIHAIGGDEDTNKNMTRRLLLLLESAPVDASESEQVHNRIVSVSYTDMSWRMPVLSLATEARKESRGSFLMTSSVFGERWPWITQTNTALGRVKNGHCGT